MRHAVDPTFRELDEEAVNDLLARHHIGRIAYAFRDRVDIEPISYVFGDGAIYMRTSPGAKLATLAHAPWAAFEVDEVTGPFAWRSAVAHGTVYVVENRGSPSAIANYRQALDRIRELMPEALTDEDPTPDRNVILKLFIAQVVGREASSGR
jgi:nitroimidazol reductase NimA-like FMN-containing flavoprotein (pyridoxamine 5'-phosphate oxidase superfamily)